MEVELQYFDDCPNWRVTDDRLRTLASELADVTVTRRLVTTLEEADRIGFRGSPTILLNGADPFATESDPVGGLSCRLYQTPDGPAGSPTLDQLRRECIRARASECLRSDEVALPANCGGLGVCEGTTWSR